MEYELPDSSGTDDDLPPTHNNQAPRGSRAVGNRRSVLGSLPYPMMHSDMEAQIHHIEQEAYGSILRAFKAQSDALTWEKEGLITELRKELRVSDDEHRELLSRVNADDVIRRIREWRQAGGHNGSVLSAPQTGHDLLPSPTVSASRKRQKTSQSVHMPFGMPSQGVHPQSVATSMQPLSSAAITGISSGAGGRKHKPGPPLPGLSSKSKQYPASTDRGQFFNRGSTETATQDPLIGRKVMTRWPDDNNFYEAVISSYNPSDGRHALVYDINTPRETWEWVDLNKISPEDIRWVGDDPGILRLEGPGGQGGRGYKNHESGIVPGAGRGVGPTKDQSRKELPPSQNGVGKKVSDEIEILHTETLLKQVERVFGANHPDLREIEKAKKMLKDHEQALMNVIAKLADASDSESDGEQPTNGRGSRNMRYSINLQGANFEGERNGERVTGSEGNQMTRGVQNVTDNQQDDYIDIM